MCINHVHSQFSSKIQLLRCWFQEDKSRVMRLRGKQKLTNSLNIVLHFRSCEVTLTDALIEIENPPHKYYVPERKNEIERVKRVNL